MVVFTCNRCGESLKKAKVEGHSYRCRPIHLTCVDCLKDFGDDYTDHMLCVSEKDRYSAKGLNGQPKKSKQQQWREIAADSCRRAIDDSPPGMTPPIRDFTIWLQTQPTIPDKEKSFLNFCKSGRPRDSENTFQFVWNLLSKAREDLLAQLQAERIAAEAEARKKKAEQMKNKKQESSDSSSSDSDSDSEDDKKSKAPKNGTEKKQEEAFEVVESKREKKKRMMSESESVINGTSETRKLKKSKKNPKTEESEDSSNLNNALDACHLNGVAEEKLSKKERKEKKKREKYEAELKTLESANSVEETDPQDQPMEEVVEETETKKSKKKKKTDLKNSESVEDEAMEEVGEESKTKKGKKKKNKKNVEEIAPVDEDTKDKKKEKKSKKQERQDEAEQVYAEKPDKKGKTAKPENGKLNDTLKMDEDNGAEFSWDTAILQVLESDNEVSLKKLSKKVINEYLLSVGDAYVDEAKIVNKFNKKLHKMHNVLVHKDKVRLKTSRD